MKTKEAIIISKKTSSWWISAWSLMTALRSLRNIYALEYFHSKNKYKTELPIVYPKAAWKSEQYFTVRSVSEKNTCATVAGYHVTWYIYPNTSKDHAQHITTSSPTTFLSYNTL